MFVLRPNFWYCFNQKRKMKMYTFVWQTLSRMALVASEYSISWVFSKCDFIFFLVSHFAQRGHGTASPKFTRKYNRSCILFHYKIKHAYYFNIVLPPK